MFPILYKIEANNLPKEYGWIRKIIYNEINEHSGSLFVSNQIIEKILHDKCNQCKLHSLFAKSLTNSLTVMFIEINSLIQ